MSAAKTLIIIPTFNEEENIARLLQRILELHPEIHLLVVDDSPGMDTANAVTAVQNAHPQNVFLNHREHGKGRGSAVLDGFRFALERDYERIFEMDADFSHRPEEIAEFLATSAHCDCVIGSRYLPNSEIRDWGWKRTLFSHWANKYARLILKIPISDYTNGYRCYTREAVTSLDLENIDAKGYVVLSEVAYQLFKKGRTFGEVTTLFVNRKRGASNLSIHEIKEAFLSVIRIRSKTTYLHLKQIIKFCMCGGSAAILDLGSLAFFVEIIGMHPQVAFFPSTFIAVAYVFLFNRFITFRASNGSLMHQLTKFIVVYFGAIVLNLGLSSFLLWIGVYYLLAKAIAIGVGAVINYLLSHHFVFRS